MASRRHHREFLLKRDPHCIYCGNRVTRHRATLDHFVPTGRGGSGDWQNQVLACKPCNKDKGDMLPLEFILWRLSQEKSVAFFESDSNI